jgi:hypothetical protein
MLINFKQKKKERTSKQTNKQTNAQRFKYTAAVMTCQLVKKFRNGAVTSYEALISAEDSFVC